MYTLYNYDKARESWGMAIADTLWFRLPPGQTHARLTVEEDAHLSSSPSLSAAYTQSVISAILERSSDNES